MRANFCGDNAVAGIASRRDGVDAPQCNERKEVGRQCGAENSLRDENIVAAGRANPSVGKRMQSFGQKFAASISGKSLPENKLGAVGSDAERRKTSEKCSSPVRPSTFLRWVKYNLVGGIGIVVQFIALFLLRTVFHLDYLTATALAVETAVVHNFVWHEQFTWADRVQPSWRASLWRFVRFNLTTGAVSIVGNLALMKVMVGFGHVNYLVANAVAIALCSTANFLVSEEWVFGEAG